MLIILPANGNLLADNAYLIMQQQIHAQSAGRAVPKITDDLSVADQRISAGPLKMKRLKLNKF